jgi:hypothetical protein
MLSVRAMLNKYSIPSPFPRKRELSDLWIDVAHRIHESPSSGDDGKGVEKRPCIGGNSGLIRVKLARDNNKRQNDSICWFLHTHFAAGSVGLH